METPDENSLEAFLPAEVVEKIRSIIAEALAPQAGPQAIIGAKAGLTLTATVNQAPDSLTSVTPRFLYRPGVDARSDSMLSADPQRILQELLNDPAISKKIWQSAEGLSTVVAVGSLIVSLYTACLQQESLTLQKPSIGLEKAKAEQGWIHSTDQPHPDPDPTPDSPLLGD
jgi:hypothetical protein